MQQEPLEKGIDAAEMQFREQNAPKMAVCLLRPPILLPMPTSRQLHRYVGNINIR